MTHSSTITIGLTTRNDTNVELRKVSIPLELGDAAASVIFWNHQKEEWDYRTADQYLPKNCLPAALAFTDGTILEFGPDCEACAIDTEVATMAVLAARQFFAHEREDWDALQAQIEAQKAKRQELRDKVDRELNAMQ